MAQAVGWFIYSRNLDSTAHQTVHGFSLWAIIPRWQWRNVQRPAPVEQAPLNLHINSERARTGCCTARRCQCAQQALKHYTQGLGMCKLTLSNPGGPQGASGWLLGLLVAGMWRGESCVGCKPSQRFQQQNAVCAAESCMKSTVPDPLLPPTLTLLLPLLPLLLPLALLPLPAKLPPAASGGCAAC